MGIDLIPVEWPARFPLAALRPILTAESAAAFDDLTRSGRDSMMEETSSWPNTFRTARLIPAVEYIQANRVRTLLIEEAAAALSDVDVLVSPTSGNDTLLLTNLTGHPCVVLPNGFRENGTPVSLSFIGRLFGEAEVLALAKAYQEATDFHTRRPPLFS